MDQAHIDAGQRAGWVPASGNELIREQVDPELLGQDGAIGIGGIDRRRCGRARELGGGLASRREPALLQIRIAEEGFAHETDDLLAAPDMVPQKLRHPLQVRAAARHRVAQIEAPVA